MGELDSRLKQMNVEQRNYTLYSLARHLAVAGQLDRLRQLLITFDYLQAKVDTLGHQLLLDDYNLAITPGRPLADDPFQVIQGSLMLSAHFLAQDTTQLAGQLLGRLRTDDAAEIQILRTQARSWSVKPWLRPLSPTLTMPGGALQQTLNGHTETINALAVTPDGRWLVSGAGISVSSGDSSDNTVRVWDLQTGAQRYVLAGHTQRVNALALTPDGRLAISAADDDTLKVWDLERGTERYTLKGHRRNVNSVTVTPDGRLAISAAGLLGSTPNRQYNMLRVWNLQNAEMLRTLRGHSEPVTAVAILPDGQRVLSGSADGTLTVWDLRNGVALQTFDTQHGVIEQLAIMHQGRYAVAAAEGAIIVWDLERGQEQRTLEFASLGRTIALAPMPDGQHIIAAVGSALGVWDLLNGTQLYTIAPGHGASVTAVAVTPDSRYAISAGWDFTLKVWDLGLASRFRVQPGATGPIEAVAVSPDGQRATSVSGERLKVWDLESGAIQKELELGHTGPIVAMTMPDAQQAIIAARDHTVKAWDLEHGAELRMMRSRHLDSWATAITPDGRWLVVGGGTNRTLAVEDLWGHKRTRIFRDLAEPPDSVAVTPDGRWAVTVGGGHRDMSGSLESDCLLNVWDAKHRGKLRTIEVRTETVSAVAITSDGRRALTGSWDGYLILWDLESGAEVFVLQGPGNEIQAVSVTPDGEFAVSAEVGNILRLWNMEQGCLIASFGGDCPFSACAITPAGTAIIAGDALDRLHILRLEEAHYGG